MKFNKSNRDNEKTNLEKEIEALFKQMAEIPRDSREYAAMLSNLEKLCAIKDKAAVKRAVSPDTIAVIAGNLLGIALILGYEKTGVIASKALGFVIRGRL